MRTQLSLTRLEAREVPSVATEPIPVVPMSAPTREFLNSIAGMGAVPVPTQATPVVPMSAPTREFLNSIAGMGAGAMPVPTQATPVVQFPTLSTPSNVLTPSPGVRNMLYVIPPLGDTSGSGVTLSVYVIPPPGTQTGPLIQNMGWRETGQATLNGIAGAVSGAGAGAATGAITGAVVTAATGPGALAGAGAGATTGAIVGGISGFIRGAFYAENPQDALEKGVTIGAATGVGGGVIGAARVIIIGTAEVTVAAGATGLAAKSTPQLMSEVQAFTAEINRLTASGMSAATPIAERSYHLAELWDRGIRNIP